MIRILSISVLFCCISACSLFDSESFEPAFLILENPKLSTKSSEGDPVQNITDAWVFLDGQLLGVFPLPAKVPIIPTGQKILIQVSAGIKFDGVENSSGEYPFFVPIITELDIESGKNYTIPLNFTYRPDAIFDLIEGFENDNHIFEYDIDGNANSRINFSNQEKVSGAKSGIMTLTNEAQDGEFASIPFFDNNKNKKGNVYLEFDYKSPEIIYVGAEQVYASSSKQIYVAYLQPTTSWKRVYINLTKEISQIAITNYRPIVGASIKQSGRQNSEIYFDNFKLVHF